MPYGFGYGNRFRDGSCRYFGYGYGPRRGFGLARRPGAYAGDPYYDRFATPERERMELKEYREYLNGELELLKQELQEVESRLKNLENQPEGE